MRLGIVRGHITLTPAVESFKSRTLAILEPVTMENLRAKNGLGGGKALIAIDELGAAKGQMVAFTEGREASNPFWPNPVPVDAYLSLIVDSYDVNRRHFRDSEVGSEEREEKHRSFRLKIFAMRDAQSALAAGVTQRRVCEQVRDHAFGPRFSAAARY